MDIQQPYGGPGAHAALLCRNSFAIASLKRRKLFEEKGEMYFRNKALLAALGDPSEKEFNWIEKFLGEFQARIEGGGV